MGRTEIRYAKEDLGATKKKNKWLRTRKALRIAVNIVTTVWALLIVPFRKMQDAGQAYRIAAQVAYRTWAASFPVVFAVLLRRQNTPLRKQLYACFILVLALYLLGFVLRTESPAGELAAFGPLAVTASAFIMDVIFETNLNITAALQTE
jgi:hypothetical protein